MQPNIRNVYCIGRNYRLHAAELGNAVPDQPMVFLKPTHAIELMDGRTISLPGHLGELHFEAEVVLYIGKQYTPGAKVEDIVSHMAIGIDFTLRDIQNELKRQAHPWLKAKGFLNSAPITAMIPFPALSQAVTIPFRLEVNGQIRQEGTMSDMIFDIQTLIDYCGQYYGLSEGDVLFTGTPAGVGAVQDGDHFRLFWNQEALGECTLSLSL